jgi:hypothetical protein
LSSLLWGWGESSTRAWSQGFVLGRQEPHLQPPLLWLFYFRERILLFAQAGLNHDPPIFLFLL